MTLSPAVQAEYERSTPDLRLKWRIQMFGLRFIKMQPTSYLLQYKKGRIVREGAGLSFFYYAPTSSLVAVPIASTDAPFIFNEVTSDFQEITIQGQANYRITDPKRVSQLLNFTLDASARTYVSDDPQKLSARVINVIKVLTRKELQTLPLRDALRPALGRRLGRVRGGFGALGRLSRLLLGDVFRTPRAEGGLEQGGRDGLILQHVCLVLPSLALRVSASLYGRWLVQFACQYARRRDRSFSTTAATAGRRDGMLIVCLPLPLSWTDSLRCAFEPFCACSLAP